MEIVVDSSKVQNYLFRYSSADCRTEQNNVLFNKRKMQEKGGKPWECFLPLECS